MSRRPTVLVADDDPAVRAIVSRIAADAVRGATGRAPGIAAVADGGQALAALEDADYAFDLIALDVDMPRATGLEVLAAALTVRPDVPVVVLSGDERHAAAACALGARAFVPKPAGLGELRAAFEAALLAPVG